MPTVIGHHDVKDTKHWLSSSKREEFFGPPSERPDDDCGTWWGRARWGRGRTASRAGSIKRATTPTSWWGS
jgi:hypothetical protein